MDELCTTSIRDYGYRQKPERKGVAPPIDNYTEICTNYQLKDSLTIRVRD
jgi:hypothetical protein